MSDDVEYYKLCEYLSIRAVVCLYMGKNPDTYTGEEMPYKEANQDSIIGRSRLEVAKTFGVEIPDFDPVTHHQLYRTLRKAITNKELSVNEHYEICVASLKTWFAQKDLFPSFFFKDSEVLTTGTAIRNKLDSREKNTLLITIAALLKQLNIDWEDRGISTPIVYAVEQIGCSIDPDTVRKSILKEIPQAIKRRQVSEDD